jgi:regulator of sirC expression with transglutaminase-like and TPR domain
VAQHAVEYNLCMDNHPGRQLLLQILRRPDPQIDLVRAALAIRWEDQGTIDLDDTGKSLDAILARARRRVAPRASIKVRAEQLVEYLHYVEGFHGEPEAFGEPESSFLPEVLERHVGLPILLSIILLRIGWNLDLPLEPAALPGHFMVRCESESGPLFLDVCYGRVMDTLECRTFLQAQLGYEVPNPERFPTPSRRQVLARLLRNLKVCYFRLEDWERALTATERILLVDPESSEEIRDRGIFRARTGRLHLAMVDFERYALIEPMAPDQDLIRKRAIAVAESLIQRN